uniref:Uncharacterized protein n=1 Tax=Periophthalmus magnuspinnatus TaxID=409849 RepID=A0A3B3ZXB5_9GOBI
NSAFLRRFLQNMRLFLHVILGLLWLTPSAGACPDSCKCSRKSGPERSEVNCHKRGLLTFPSNLPPDTWNLKLDLKAALLKTVPKIESLNLERNAIKFIHPQAFTGAKQLMLLKLYGNHISTLPPRELRNLRFLMLGQNEIGALRPDMFVGLRNLSELDLPLNGLSKLTPNAFKPLIVLKVLDLSMNRITTISPKAFTGLRQLLFLNLDNNSIKTLPAGVFKPLRALEMLLHLHDNPWHCDCNIRSLVQYLSQTQSSVSPSLRCVSPQHMTLLHLRGNVLCLYSQDYTKQTSLIKLESKLDSHLHMLVYFYSAQNGTFPEQLKNSKCISRLIPVSCLRTVSPHSHT